MSPILCRVEQSKIASVTQLLSGCANWRRTVQATHLSSTSTLDITQPKQAGKLKGSRKDPPRRSTLAVSDGDTISTHARTTVVTGINRYKLPLVVMTDIMYYWFCCKSCVWRRTHREHNACNKYNFWYRITRQGLKYCNQSFWQRKFVNVLILRNEELVLAVIFVVVMVCNRLGFFVVHVLAISSLEVLEKISGWKTF